MLLMNQIHFLMKYAIHSKLIISTCPIIYPYDFIITKDEDKNEYNIFSFGKVLINGVPTKSNQFSNINS